MASSDVRSLRCRATLRRAALARFHAELPFDAVASRLGTEPVTARTRVHRALERLRARVGGLRAVFAWFPGAQATALGLTLVAGVARPPLLPAPVVLADAEAPSVPHTHAARWARAEVLVARPPVATPAARRAPTARLAAAPRVEEPAPSAVQRFDYDDDEVTGELAGPDGIVLDGEPVVRQPSLIELRTHFVPELLKTLEDI